MKGDGELKGFIVYTQFKKKRGKWTKLLNEKHWAKALYIKVKKDDMLNPDDWEKTKNWEEDPRNWGKVLTKIGQKLAEKGNPTNQIRIRRIYGEKGFRKGQLCKPFFIKRG